MAMTAISPSLVRDVPGPVVSSSSMSTSERLALRKANAAKNRAERNSVTLSARSALASPALSSPSNNRLKLSYSEQRILKSGIRKFHSTVALREDAPPLLQFATRPNGSSFLLPESKSYFEKLLSNQVQLQSSTKSDVCSSQRDLRYLSLEQLLVLRVGTLDFATMSESHAAHTNWNEILDGHLFKHLAKRHLKSSWTPPDEALYRLGFQMALILGAFETLQADEEGTAKLVPSQWAMPLDAQEWEGKRLVLFFHVTDLQVSLLALDRPEDVKDVARKSAVGIVWDRSSGFGKDRQLTWEVACLDPATDEVIFAELERANRGKVAPLRMSSGDAFKVAVENRKLIFADKTANEEQNGNTAQPEYFNMCSPDEVDDPSLPEKLASGNANTSGFDSPRMPSLPSVSFAPMTSYHSIVPMVGQSMISQQSPTLPAQVGPMPSLPPQRLERAPFHRVTFEYEDEGERASIEQVPQQFRVRKSMVQPLPPPEFEHLREEVRQRGWTTMIN